jgi:hypothetical protein
LYACVVVQLSNGVCPILAASAAQDVADWAAAKLLPVVAAFGCPAAARARNPLSAEALLSAQASAIALSPRRTTDCPRHPIRSAHAMHITAPTNSAVLRFLLSWLKAHGLQGDRTRPPTLLAALGVPLVEEYADAGSWILGCIAAIVQPQTICQIRGCTAAIVHP